MSQIFDNLWIAGAEDVYSHSFLSKIFPTHIINCTTNESLYYGEIFVERFRIQLKDNNEDDTNEIIEGANLINKLLVPESRIIVHCAAGISRSATVVIAFLILHKGYSYKQAFDFVLEKRPVINPNKFYLEFLGQL